MSQHKSEHERQKEAAAERRKLDEAAAQAQLPGYVDMQPFMDKTPSEADESSAETTHFRGTPNAQWKDILDDYKKFCIKNNITPAEHKEDVLSFSTKEQAEAFFEAQAKLKRPFCCVELDSTGKPMDNHMFSCGDGKLYKGAAEKIRGLLASNPKALEQFNSFNPIATPNPTQTMREAMKEATKPLSTAESLADAGLSPGAGKA